MQGDRVFREPAPRAFGRPTPFRLPFPASRRRGPDGMASCSTGWLAIGWSSLPLRVDPLRRAMRPCERPHAGGLLPEAHLHVGRTSG
jgi:hypothetical protein